MKKLLMLTAIFLMITTASCSSSSDDDEMIPDPPPPTNITYANTISGIMSSKCTTCHGNPTTQSAPFSLTTLANVKDAINNNGLISAIGPGGTMPKTGTKLTATQVANITAWKTAGFP